MKDHIVRQAADDYDIDYDIVKGIHDKDPEKLYDNLEEYLVIRRNSDTEL